MRITNARRGLDRAPAPGEVVRYPIEAGQRGINRRMIPRMVKAVQEDHAHPVVRETALEIIRDSGCRERDKACYAAAVYQWVDSRFHWIDDPILEETFRWPRKFVKELRSVAPGKKVLADCATVNASLIALLGAINVRAAFAFAGDGEKEGGEPVVYHVFTVLPDVGDQPAFLEPTLHLPAGKAQAYPQVIVVDPWKDAEA